jgi:hypothetical protein
MLQRRIRVYQNPWEHTVPNDTLVLILETIASERAESVARQLATGTYQRDSLGLAILNPAAPDWQPSDEALLATIAIGLEGERLVLNAIAKAVMHRDKGKIAGYGAYVDLTQSQDGDFTWGFSSQVDGTIVGASGQTELQDAYEAGHAAVEFNYEIRDARRSWFDRQESKPRWFCNVDQPRQLYVGMAAGPTIYDSEVKEHSFPGHAAAHELTGPPFPLDDRD